jgi:hypothetical protein
MSNPGAKWLIFRLATSSNQLQEWVWRALQPQKLWASSVQICCLPLRVFAMPCPQGFLHNYGNLLQKESRVGFVARFNFLRRWRDAVLRQRGRDEPLREYL